MRYSTSQHEKCYAVFFKVLAHHTYIYKIARLEFIHGIVRPLALLLFPTMS